MISLFTRNSYRWSLLACVILGMIGTLALTRATSAKATSGSESQPWYRAFNEVYALADGEVLKLVPPPFIPERRNYFRQGLGEMVQATADVPACVLSYENGRLSLTAFDLPPTTSQVNKLPSRSLVTLIGWLPEFHLCDFDLPVALAKLPVPPGDWVVDKKASQTAVLKALEAILRDQWKRDVRFEQKDVERVVVVMSGKFKFTPLPNAEKPKTVYFSSEGTAPPDDKSSNRGHGVTCIGGNMDNMKSAIEEYLRIPAINETHDEPKGVRNAEFDLLQAEERQNPEIRNRVLANITKQTGLVFRIERRLLLTWTMSEGAADSNR